MEIREQAVIDTLEYVKEQVIPSVCESAYQMESEPEMMLEKIRQDEAKLAYSVLIDAIDSEIQQRTEYHGDSQIDDSPLEEEITELISRISGVKDHIRKNSNLGWEWCVETLNDTAEFLEALR